MMMITGKRRIEWCGAKGGQRMGKRGPTSTCSRSRWMTRRGGAGAEGEGEHVRKRCTRVALSSRASTITGRGRFPPPFVFPPPPSLHFSHPRANHR